ncbi:MAG: L-serine ammonia-lyase, iron-sulfur-dependent, subunit beta [Clostridiales bacterium]|nr:L-serine ammonia-lyase, iron-sulfur-dependent, subunit beta [Clostridiales bacterium]
MNLTLFDIIGPIMIGPSSSHTAGAARIGLITRHLLGEKPTNAIIELHGSFSKTYKGHGTDRALVGGLLNMPVDDERLRDSLSLAKTEGLNVVFEKINLPDAHPNTVVLTVTGQSGKHIKVQGASIGGGNIRIESLDGMEVSFSGNENTLIVFHQDSKGAIASVSGLLCEKEINIATMRVFRESIGKKAIMVLEVDSPPDQKLLSLIGELPLVHSVTFLEKEEM